MERIEKLTAEYRAKLGDDALRSMSKPNYAPTDSVLNRALRSIGERKTDDARWAMRRAVERVHRHDATLVALEGVSGRRDQLHDSDLRSLASDGDQDAARVLALRDVAAREVRLALARVYGVGTMATFSAWSVVPCMTESGTFGVLDTARGTAWSTPIALTVEACEALGLIGDIELSVHGAAAGATVEVSGDGRRMVVGAGRKTMEGSDYHKPAPSMPPGWRQIVLPTWRSAYPGEERYRDTEPVDFRPETWALPTLVASGLMTCYGRPGDPAAGERLLVCHGWEGSWPWGVPSWIDGTSVSVIDALIDSIRGLRRTRRPRGSDQDECELVRRLLDVAIAKLRASLTGLIRQVEKIGDDKLAPKDRKSALVALKGVIQDPSDEALAHARRVLVPVGNATNGQVCWPFTDQMRAVVLCRSALDRGDPWSAARSLASFGAEVVLETVPDAALVA